MKPIFILSSCSLLLDGKTCQGSNRSRIVRKSPNRRFFRCNRRFRNPSRVRATTREACKVRCTHPATSIRVERANQGIRHGGRGGLTAKVGRADPAFTQDPFHGEPN